MFALQFLLIAVYRLYYTVYINVGHDCYEKAGEFVSVWIENACSPFSLRVKPWEEKNVGYVRSFGIVSPLVATQKSTLWATFVQHGLMLWIRTRWLRSWRRRTPSSEIFSLIFDIYFVIFGFILFHQTVFKTSKSCFLSCFLYHSLDLRWFHGCPTLTLIYKTAILAFIVGSTKGRYKPQALHSAQNLKPTPPG